MDRQAQLPPLRVAAPLEGRVRVQGFIRAHRRALVRLGGVRELMWTDAGALVAVLGSGVRIPISRRRRAVFAAAVRSQVY